MLTISKWDHLARNLSLAQMTKAVGKLTLKELEYFGDLKVGGRGVESTCNGFHAPVLSISMQIIHK